MHYHVSAKRSVLGSQPSGGVCRVFEAQPSQLASYDARLARARARTPSLASRGGPHDSRLTAHSPTGRARSRCASRKPAGRAGRAPPRSPSAWASHPAGARCSSTTSVPGGTSPRATSGSSSSPPSRSRYAPRAFTTRPVRAPRPSPPRLLPSPRAGPDPTVSVSARARTTRILKFHRRPTPSPPPRAGQEEALPVQEPRQGARRPRRSERRAHLRPPRSPRHPPRARQGGLRGLGRVAQPKSVSRPPSSEEPRRPRRRPRPRSFRRRPRLVPRVPRVVPLRLGRRRSRPRAVPRAPRPARPRDGVERRQTHARRTSRAAQSARAGSLPRGEETPPGRTRRA